MTPYYQNDQITLYHGDCRTILPTLGADSIDACVTDPPYGIGFMGREWDTFSPEAVAKRGAERRRKTTVQTSERYPEKVSTRSQGGGVQIDYDESASGNQRFQAWVTEWAREVYRVLKPGAHFVCFGGTRTFHRLTSGIEDAGFEIRDCLTWLYGSGFPKSLDVGKAIDKRRNDSDDIRNICRFIRSAIDRHETHTTKTIATIFGFDPRMVDHWAARDTDSQPALPTLEQWDQLRNLLGFNDSMDGEVYRLNMRKGEPGESWKDRPVTGTVEAWSDRTNYAMTTRDGIARDVAVSDAAREWDGWGTALKPAWEPIIMARKPFRGTVAANVLHYGTGAINVDACRIRTSKQVPGSLSGPSAQERGYRWGAKDPDQSGQNPDIGRWPANVVLDETAAAMLDESVGTLTSGANPTRRTSDKFQTAYGEFPGQRTMEPNRGSDSGGPSRFFYIAKASRSERNAGLDDRDAQPLNWSSGDQSPGTFQSANTDRTARNHHPTVKPLSLMQWLVRLVTPPDGVVLDPFCGSGTTVCATTVEGFRAIAIDRESDYLDITRGRLTHPRQRGLTLD